MIFFLPSIGLAIAKRLCQDGAKVMISSRKQKNVDAAVQQLRSENLQVSGIVCHVSKQADRAKLIDEVITYIIYMHNIIDEVISVVVKVCFLYYEALWSFKKLFLLVI